MKRLLFAFLFLLMVLNACSETDEPNIPDFAWNYEIVFNYRGQNYTNIMSKTNQSAEEVIPIGFRETGWFHFANTNPVDSFYSFTENFGSISGPGTNIYLALDNLTDGIHKQTNNSLVRVQLQQYNTHWGCSNSIIYITNTGQGTVGSFSSYPLNLPYELVTGTFRSWRAY